MLHVLKRLIDRDVYWEWEEATNPVRTWFAVYSPFEDMEVGKNGYVCDEKGISACGLYCCSDRLSAFINPLEGVILPPLTSTPLSSFLAAKSPVVRIWKNKKAQASTVFQLKTENGYCIFNDRPNSSKCNEYSHRPLQCRMYPFVYVENRGLVQRKSCPGFKKGEIATNNKMQYFREIGRIATLLDGMLFEVDSEDLFEKRYGKIGNEIWDRMDVDPESTIETITKDYFHEKVEKVKKMANLEEELKKMGIDQNYFEDFMLANFLIERPLAIATI